MKNEDHGVACVFNRSRTKTLFGSTPYERLRRLWGKRIVGYLRPIRERVTCHGASSWSGAGSGIGCWVRLRQGRLRMQGRPAMVRVRIKSRGIPIGVFTVSSCYYLKSEFRGLPVVIVIAVMSQVLQPLLSSSVVSSTTDEISIVDGFGSSSGSPDHN